MDSQRLSVALRFFYAIILPWRLIFDGVFAAQVRDLLRGSVDKQLKPVKSDAALSVESASTVQELREQDYAAPALQLLSVLQREGRLLDFLQEDIASFEDHQVGAAARVVHEGCKRGLAKYLTIKKIREESEGSEVVLPDGFDATRTRLTGNVVGEAPFHGRLAHHGWQVTKIELPQRAKNYNPKIVAPAEVEL